MPNELRQEIVRSLITISVLTATVVYELVTGEKLDLEGKAQEEEAHGTNE